MEQNAHESHASAVTMGMAIIAENNRYKQTLWARIEKVKQLLKTATAEERKKLDVEMEELLRLVTL